MHNQGKTEVHFMTEVLISGICTGRKINASDMAFCAGRPNSAFHNVLNLSKSTTLESHTLEFAL